MSIVYIANQGASLIKKQERIYVIKGKETLRWFHTKDIEQIILLGNISLTAPIITFILKRKIDLVFLSYYGKYKGRLIGEFGKNIELRKVQFNYLSSETNCLKFAQNVVVTKIHNSLQHLRKRNRKLKNKLITASIIKIRAILAYNVTKTDNIDSLRGYEGLVAKEYYSCFSHLIINPNFFFNGRNKRPPKDEVNALLSLSYTFLFNQVLSATYVAGLDPYYGALHQIHYGRQSLSLDLMEEYRPLIDDFVISLLNKKQFSKDYFEYNNIDTEDPEDGFVLPIMLSKDGMRKFVNLFYRFIEKKNFYPPINGKLSLKNIFLAQARIAINSFREKSPYKGFEI